jgi:predicted DNA-binding protein
MTIRKNFLFDDEVAKHLEEIAKAEGKTQTQIAQEAIEERYKTIEIKKKLEALDRITGSFSGLIGDIDAKEARRTHVLEKYGK